MSDTKRCEYCSGRLLLFERDRQLSRKSDFYPGLDISIYGDSLCIEGCADTYEPNYIEIGVKINFCPMCGEKLTEE